MLHTHVINSSNAPRRVPHHIYIKSTLAIESTKKRVVRQRCGCDLPVRCFYSLLLFSGTYTRIHSRFMPALCVVYICIVMCICVVVADKSCHTELMARTLFVYIMFLIKNYCATLYYLLSFVVVVFSVFYYKKKEAKMSAYSK